MHDVEKWLGGGLTAVLTWIVGKNALSWFQGVSSVGKAVIDSTAANKREATAAHKVEVDADVAREKLAQEARSDHDKRIAEEAEFLRMTSRALMEEARKNHQEFKEEVREQIKELKEDVQQATVFANVASMAAADKEAEARKLRAEKSLCDIEIASLLGQLLAVEQDKKKQREQHEEEKRQLQGQIALLEARSADLEKRIAHMTAIILKKHPDTKHYPEDLASEAAIDDYLLNLPEAPQNEP